jgi:phage gp16-like protein
MAARPDPLRRRELAAIHAAVKQLGLDDDTYRALLRQQCNVDSAAGLDGPGRHRILDALRARGWQPPKSPPRSGPGAAQAAKIRALWGELERRGLVRDGSVKALRSFVRRMTGVEEGEWLDGPRANVVIEALKGWLHRGERPREASDGTA